MSDYTVTEAGFGADLGAEKFPGHQVPYERPVAQRDRAGGHGARAQASRRGPPRAPMPRPNPEALRAGMANLLSHVKNIREVWQSPVVVALNRFATDTAENWTWSPRCWRSRVWPARPATAGPRAARGPRSWQSWSARPPTPTPRRFPATPILTRHRSRQDPRGGHAHLSRGGCELRSPGPQGPGAAGGRTDTPAAPCALPRRSIP